MGMAIMYDLLILLRILAALILRERGNSWIFYVVLLYSSPISIGALMSAIDYLHNLYMDQICHECSLPVHLIHMAK